MNKRLLKDAIVSELCMDNLLEVVFDFIEEDFHHLVIPM